MYGRPPIPKDWELRQRQKGPPDGKPPYPYESAASGHQGELAALGAVRGRDVAAHACSGGGTPDPRPKPNPEPSLLRGLAADEGEVPLWRHTGLLPVVLVEGRVDGAAVPPPHVLVKLRRGCSRKSTVLAHTHEPAQAGCHMADLGVGEGGTRGLGR